MIQAPEDDSFLVEVDGGVLRLSFNRPEAGNATPPAMVPPLISIFQDAQSDPSVRAVLVRGEGPVFSAGADLNVFASSIEMDREARQTDFYERLTRMRKLSEAVLALDKPLVVALRGAAAAAGLLYPLAADVVIAEPDAVLAFIHQGVGLSPDGAVSWLLPQIVGSRTARRLLLTAAKVSADEALHLGMIDEIVAPGTLEEHSMKIARRLARAPQLAIRTAKRLVRQAAAGTTLAEQLDAERAGIVACVGDDDFTEGVQAVIERRQSNFPSVQVGSKG